MGKLNKTQRKRILKLMQSRATILFTATPNPAINMKDYDAIIKITDRALNKLK